MKFLIIVFLVVLVASPLQAEGVYVHDLGDGNFVAASNRRAGEWMVTFYYWLQEISFGESGGGCEVSPDQ